MLYAFYTKETHSNPGSLHASYMLTGFRAEKNKEEKDADEDTAMGSSPFDAEPRLVRTVVVVPEEKLEGTRMLPPLFLPALLTHSRRNESHLHAALQHRDILSASVEDKRSPPAFSSSPRNSCGVLEREPKSNGGNVWHDFESRFKGRPQQSTALKSFFFSFPPSGLSGVIATYRKNVHDPDRFPGPFCNCKENSHPDYGIQKAREEDEYPCGSFQQEVLAAQNAEPGVLGNQEIHHHHHLAEPRHHYQHQESYAVRRREEDAERFLLELECRLSKSERQESVPARKDTRNQTRV
jgi:hypothetical protein